jgi:hypothetical protein
MMIPRLGTMLLTDFLATPYLSNHPPTYRDPRRAHCHNAMKTQSKSSLFVGGSSGCLHGREPYLDEGRSMWQMWCWTKEALAAPADPGKKTRLLRRFYTKIAPFAKTGSGQTYARVYVSVLYTDRRSRERDTRHHLLMACRVGGPNESAPNIRCRGSLGYGDWDRSK